ncbi:MAG: peroxidase family protein, partial [Actinomycetota bacterium]|nr:peroxidase family protein [Actinomycetota bacterium]
PNQWNNDFFKHLFEFEWELFQSPAGANQWRPKDGTGDDRVPDPHDPDSRHHPTFLTTDLALRFDPEYEKISRRFLENPAEFEDAFARAWFKLLHRDMGPNDRYLGPEVPDEDLIWQDPVPAGPQLSSDQIGALKGAILDTGLSVQQLVATAWASASTFRGTDLRGGANGARIRLAPQKDWEVNQVAGVADVITALESVQSDFDGEVSIADLIVLGGCAAVEKAAADAGHNISVPFSPGRGDASQEMTEVDSFAYLKPTADGFRNYLSPIHKRPAEGLLVDKAFLLNLTAPEMTVLVGGMRALDVNVGGAQHGVFTDRPGQLTTDFFVNLLDMGTEWKASESSEGVFEGRSRETGEVRWTGTAADLVFGSNSQLRALAEVYACDDSHSKFVDDFVAAWHKVMSLDRFDLA